MSRIDSNSHLNFNVYNEISSISQKKIDNKFTSFFRKIFNSKRHKALKSMTKGDFSVRTNVKPYNKKSELARALNDLNKIYEQLNDVKSVNDFVNNNKYTAKQKYNVLSEYPDLYELMQDKGVRQGFAMCALETEKLDEFVFIAPLEYFKKCVENHPEKLVKFLEVASSVEERTKEGFPDLYDFPKNLEFLRNYICGDDINDIVNFVHNDKYTAEQKYNVLTYHPKNPEFMENEGFRRILAEYALKTENLEVFISIAPLEYFKECVYGNPEKAIEFLEIVNRGFEGLYDFPKNLEFLRNYICGDNINGIVNFVHNDKYTAEQKFYTLIYHPKNPEFMENERVRQGFAKCALEIGILDEFVFEAPLEYFKKCVYDNPGKAVEFLEAANTALERGADLTKFDFSQNLEFIQSYVDRDKD